MFKRISYTIAAQFMAFVFVLLLITGSIFIVVDIENRDRMMYRRLEQTLRPFMDHPEDLGRAPLLPAHQRERIRIADADGQILFSGSLYEGIPFDARINISTVTSGDDSYNILTAPITRDGVIVGYIQVGDRSPPNDLTGRALLFLLISGAISALTFGVGLFFARRSLKPAAQMMERLEQFTQDASHELKTPLTAVNTSLDLALLEHDPRGQIASAKKDLKEVFTLVDRLLELARLDSFVLQKESVDVPSLIDDVIAKYQAQAEEKQVVIEKQAAVSKPVQADPALLRQVVGNLLGNAIKFNKQNGRIAIGLTNKTLSIQDTGRGISAPSLAHIFDRFYQEDASRTKGQKGLGLGLALVKRIVDLHGWTIDVKSKEGEGTTFTIRFA